MDRDEKYFELLLSEKQHADSAIDKPRVTISEVQSC
jgi:hypothetical protein